MKFRSVLVTILIIILTGCSNLGSNPDPIRVTVVTIEPLASTLLEQQYLITLRIQNHSENAIKLRGGSFDVAINGKNFASGVSSNEVDIPPFSESRIQVKMFSTLFSVFRTIQGFSPEQTEELQFEVSGYISVAGHRRIRFREKSEPFMPASADKPQEPNTSR